jgi:hypothetical protein
MGGRALYNKGGRTAFPKACAEHSRKRAWSIPESLREAFPKAVEKYFPPAGKYFFDLQNAGLMVKCTRKS